jgi:hypothetical protein
MRGRKAGLSGAAFFDLYTDPREEGEDAADVPCEGNVQCQDGSLTLYAGAKSSGVDRESNWLPASGPFSLYIRAYWAGAPSSMVSGDRRLSSDYNRQLTTACATWFRDANEDDISNVGCWHL